MVSWNLKSGSRVSVSSAENWASDKRLLAWATREKDGTLIKLWLDNKKTQTTFFLTVHCGHDYLAPSMPHYFILKQIIWFSPKYLSTIKSAYLLEKNKINIKSAYLLEEKYKVLQLCPLRCCHRPICLVHQDSLPFQSPVNFWEVLAQSWRFSIGLLFSGGGGVLALHHLHSGSHGLEMENMDENDDKVEILKCQTVHTVYMFIYFYRLFCYFWQ